VVVSELLRAAQELITAFLMHNLLVPKDRTKVEKLKALKKANRSTGLWKLVHSKFFVISVACWLTDGGGLSRDKRFFFGGNK